MRYLKIPNDKNKKSCDQNDETFWSHDLTKIEIVFEISCGDVDSSQFSDFSNKTKFSLS